MNDSKPLTQRELSAATCNDPGCKHGAHDGSLVLSGSCHPKEPVYVVYEKGVLQMNCGVCARPVIKIAVAAGMADA